MAFFKNMKRSRPFKWTPEAAAAFEELKRYLVSPAILVAPRPREPLRRSEERRVGKECRL